MTAKAGNSKSNTEEVRVASLRCEYQNYALGIDMVRPRFSWTLEGSTSSAGIRQQAYRIVVSSAYGLEAAPPTTRRAVGGSDRGTEDAAVGFGDLWDSGWVESGRSIQVEYAGKPLQSRDRGYAAVEVRTADGRESAWSEECAFELGLLSQEDWRAVWIGEPAAGTVDDYLSGGAPYFRREFTNDIDEISRARLYVSGLGFFRAFLNGTRVGDEVLSPGQTNYDRRGLRRLLYPFRDDMGTRVLYRTFDVTGLLQAGRNCLGVVLGNGWYNQRDRRTEGEMWYDTPRLIAQLEFSDHRGIRTTIGTDGTWSVTSAGPIVQNGIFTGVTYDRRLELTGWSLSGYDDSGWSRAVLVRPPEGVLRAQVSPPDRVVAAWHPAAVETVSAAGDPSVYRIDAGVHATGWVRLATQGPAGRRIAMRYFQEDGRDFGQRDIFALKGEGRETLEPWFTWHSFRTVKVTGLDSPPERADIEIAQVHADVKPVGRFECSEPLLNRLFEVYRRTQAANLHCGVPSDCPHRERIGYTGDGHISAEAAMFAFDMSAFYTKWIADIADSQNRESGFVPHTAPFEGGGGGPTWGAACVILPWLMYLFYGDTRILEEQYPVARAWLRYLLENCTDEDGIVRREEPDSWYLGDWVTPDGNRPELSPDFVNTAYLILQLDLSARWAVVLGRDAEAGAYRTSRERTTAAFNTEYLDTATGRYSIGRQGADALALFCGAVPAETRRKTLDSLLANLRGTAYHFDTGIMATPALLGVLARNGLMDTAYRLMTQSDFPSFGYMLEQGATTLWESWRGDSSWNHPMFGSVCAWLFTDICGIRPDPRFPGFGRILFAPRPPRGLRHAHAEFESIRGRFESSWERTAGGMEFTLTIPPNSSAAVDLPGCRSHGSILGPGPHRLVVPAD